jgi:cytochrome c556
MNLMKSLGRSIKTLSDMFRQKATYDRAIIVSRSMEINVYRRSMSELFPANSILGPSEASPATWQDWAEFERLAGRLVAEITKLAVIAPPSSPWHPSWQAEWATKLCTECHTRF